MITSALPRFDPHRHHAESTTRHNRSCGHQTATTRPAMTASSAARESVRERLRFDLYMAAAFALAP
jgi:hypothetical protein